MAPERLCGPLPDRRCCLACILFSLEATTNGRRRSNCHRLGISIYDAVFNLQSYLQGSLFSLSDGPIGAQKKVT